MVVAVSVAVAVAVAAALRPRCCFVVSVVVVVVVLLAFVLFCVQFVALPSVESGCWPPKMVDGHDQCCCQCHFESVFLVDLK